MRSRTIRTKSPGHSAARIRMALVALMAPLALTALAAGAAAQATGQGQQQQPGAATSAPDRAPWSVGHVLRVCADPDNLPFTDKDGKGFDNAIAAMLAEEFGDTLTYVWWPARRGFIRNTLRARECDLVIGVPTEYDPVLPTKPYYRSTYYLVTRADRKLDIKTLDDPRLKKLKIGVNLIGEDYEHTPPVHALLARGISANVTGFMSYYGEDYRPGEIIKALERGDIDVAIAWGPLAGYFAKQSTVPMVLVPLPNDKPSGRQFEFSVSLGVRRSDKDLRARLDEILERRRADVERILREYNVPTIPASAPGTADKSADGRRE
jgi:mxaJ protein